MNKARAMLDSLMGPGRDVSDKRDRGRKDKFKDEEVCKFFLIGFCPFGKDVLGGKRTIELCEKLHSDMMKEQFEKHADKEQLQKEYESSLLRDLEYCVRECGKHIEEEKKRIKDDEKKKKPPLPHGVHEELFWMKKESDRCITRAEKLDDDEFREKEALMKKSEELLKDRAAREEEEMKKAREAAREDLCEICGQAYVGDDAREQHVKFKVHEGYVKVREKITELKPKVEDFETAQRDAKDQERKKRRKEEWDAAMERDTRRGRDRDRGRARDEERPRGRSRSQRGGAMERDTDRGRYKDRGRARDEERHRGRSRSQRGGVMERGTDRGRDRDRARAR